MLGHETLIVLQMFQQHYLGLTCSQMHSIDATKTSVLRITGILACNMSDFKVKINMAA